MRTIAMFTGLIVALAATPTGAHHSWNTVFSEDKPLVLRSTLTKVELVNPHGWIWIDVKAPDGTVAKWGIEGGPPNNLIRDAVKRGDAKATITEREEQGAATVLGGSPQDEKK